MEGFAEKVGTFAGQVVERSPQGLVAVFGLDLMEDPVGRATSAALAMCRLAESAGAVVRLGLHAKRCLVAAVPGRHDIDLDGKRSAWAALDAVLARAGPGEVWASADTLPFLRGGFEVEAAGITDVARASVRVRGRASPDRRFRTAFIGRQAELTFLNDRLAAARAGHGQIVGLVGEPGAGKSRLVAEFRILVRREGLVYVEGACVPHGAAIPYLPMIDLLRRACGIGTSDAPDLMAQKVRVTLRMLRLDVDETAAYLLPLLGLGEESAVAVTADTMAPQARRVRTISILREIALAASRRGPVVLVVEDLQWIDQTSEACLTALIDSLAGAPILVLTTYRASYRPWWLERSYATQVALSALSVSQSRDLLQSLLPTSFPDDVVRALVDRGDGNPFFLEELARAQREESSGRHTAVLPETVQEVLQRRIDRLPSSVRRVLLAAAIVGRRVPRWLLEAIWSGPEDLDASLRTLVALEFLYERGGDEPAWAFRHALTHEVAYANLSVGERRILHAAAGEALECRHRDRLDPVLEQLARHYALSPRADKAVSYLARFAEKAAQTHAHTEAIQALDEALARVDDLPAPERPPRRADLLLRQVASLLPLGRFREAHDRLLAPELQAVAPTEATLAGPYYFLRARTASFLGAHADARASAELAIEAGRRAGDVRMVGKAHAFLALDAALTGQTQTGLEHGHQALALLEGIPEQGWLGMAHWAIGLGQAAVGEFARALDAQAQARVIAAAIGDRTLQASVAWATGAIHAAAGDGAAAIRACQESLAQAPDPLQAALARGWLGYAYVEQGDPDAAIPLLEQSTRELAAFQFARHGWFRVFLAEAYRQRGRLDDASDAASAGLAAMTPARLGYGIGWGHRVLGRIARTRRVTVDAEAHFMEAHRTFVAIDARYEVARTEQDLAALAEERGDAGRTAAYRAAAQSRLETLGSQRDPGLTDPPQGQPRQELAASRHDARQAGPANAPPPPEGSQSEGP
jgi:tetratricopeptide (TPR) repeat protein/ABC-type cobalamin transport system ATPase subunit